MAHKIYDCNVILATKKNKREILKTQRMILVEAKLLPHDKRKLDRMYGEYTIRRIDRLQQYGETIWE